MECPYCEKIMDLGVIYGGRYEPKWIPKEKDKGFGMFLNPFVKGVKVSNDDIGNRIESYYCKDCNKIIIDVPKVNY